MADETPQSTEPEQAETNLATANQSPATVVTVYDADGREHFASPTSKRIVDGLADGTFTTKPPAKTDEGPANGEQSTEEVPSGAEAGSAGDDPEPRSTDGDNGSEDGPADAAGTGRRRRAGAA